MLLHNKKYQLGQTIIEGVVALSAIVVVLTAISIATITSLNNSQFIKNQSLASKLAQQTMEGFRYVRNNDPNTFFNVYASNNYCMNAAGNLSAPPCLADNYSGISGVSFVREVKFTAASPYCSNGTQVEVKVSWTSGKCLNTTQDTRYCHKSQIVSCFANPSASGASL